MEHENTIGETSEWYTPKDLMQKLNVSFCLDPCSPGTGHWINAKKIYTKKNDGLKQKWKGFVFMNPPFLGRNGHVPWLKKFFRHGDGIAIARAYTSSTWFQDFAPLADCIVFPRGKTKFIRTDGSVGKSPGGGIVLFGCGKKAVKSLKESNIGLFYLTENSKN